MSQQANAKITVTSDLGELGIIRGFVNSAARQFGFPEGDVSKIELAVDEACSNVMRHAYDDDSTRSLDVAVETDGVLFRIVIDDNGKSYNILTHQLPDQREYLTDHRRGGLGIMLIRKLMDDVYYLPLHGRNRLILEKALPAPK